MARAAEASAEPSTAEQASHALATLTLTLTTTTIIITTIQGPKRKELNERQWNGRKPSPSRTAVCRPPRTRNQSSNNNNSNDNKHSQLCSLSLFLLFWFSRGSVFHFQRRDGNGETRQKRKRTRKSGQAILVAASIVPHSFCFDDIIVVVAAATCFFLHPFGQPALDSERRKE